ncbi:MAG: UTP--glucose-1-phosphate uridylyltransferase, partial [Chitinispirillaceae bacterium]|nr:UTP--glucose-1-phosphate uridylyltransferase [Chitinispirillaceae bacterium]
MRSNTHLSYEDYNKEYEKNLYLFKEKMEREKLPEIVIKNFLNFYNRVYRGEKGYIKENEISSIPFDSNKELKWDKDLSQYGREALSKTVVLKLNGGLGTTMGCSNPKSLIKVKNGYTFLDLCIKNMFVLREKYGIEIPLLLMNSFYSNEATIAALSNYPPINKNLPVTFVQNKFPRINPSDLSPLSFPENKELEWNPCGHADLYIALFTSGLLDILIEKGYQYLFISNIDNLGASVDLSILGYMVKNSFNFLMEVTKRTNSDKKGGHLAIRKEDNHLILRELSQCEENELIYFTDINKHALFNTNNIWLDIRELKRILIEKNFLLDLPFICNRKKIDYKGETISFFQLECAIGSGILLFSHPSYTYVNRERFVPVKTTEDLLRVQSNCFIITDEYLLKRNTNMCNSNLPEIKLDPNYYAKIDDFIKRFSKGVPLL